MYPSACDGVNKNTTQKQYMFRSKGSAFIVAQILGVSDVLLVVSADDVRGSYILGKCVTSLF